LTSGSVVNTLSHVSESTLTGGNVRKREYETIYVEFDGPVARLVLNRPEKLNAYNVQMAYEVRQACDEIEQDVESRVLIVKGAGRAFSAGNDLTPGPVRASRFVPEGLPVPHQIRDSGQSVYATWEYFRYIVETWHGFWTMRKPTIAQVHGYCLAGAVMIAMECDIVVASEGCQIGQPELRAQGTAPDIALWPFSIGLRRTKELLFTGYNLTGRDAAEWGMINHAVPAKELEPFVEKLAGTVANMRPELLHYYKSMTNRVADRMGLREMIDIGTDINTLVSAVGTQSAFLENANDEGLRRALDRRDQPFGGQLMPDWLIHSRAPGAAEPVK
jgi:enoyl-CoA hydratase